MFSFNFLTFVVTIDIFINLIQNFNFKSLRKLKKNNELFKFKKF